MSPRLASKLWPRPPLNYKLQYLCLSGLKLGLRVSVIQVFRLLAFEEALSAGVLQEAEMCAFGSLWRTLSTVLENYGALVLGNIDTFLNVSIKISFSLE